jgi:hypothetical protein
MRNPSGFCGMSSVSKSDFALTVADPSIQICFEKAPRGRPSHACRRTNLSGKSSSLLQRPHDV